jgi:MscS family membrane protein
LLETGKQAHIVSVDFFSSANNTVESFNDLKEQINFEIIKLVEQQSLSFFEGDGLRK